MPTVNVEYGNVDTALAILRTQVEAQGINKALREKEFYEKPSQRRKRKANAARRRHLAEQGRLPNQKKVFDGQHHSVV